MSGRIEQVNVSYSRDQDRLLLRIRSTANEEYRIWMTRRYTQLLVQAIEKILRTEAPGDAAPQPVHREAEVAFEHDHVTAQADYDTPYNAEAESYPLGEDGILGYRITVEAKAKPIAMIHLLPKEGAGVSLPAQHQLLHNVHHLLRQAAEGADWGLSFGLERFAQGSSSRLIN